MQTDPVAPAFENDNIPVILAADNNYVPFVSTLLLSLQAHCRRGNYDVIVITKDISQGNRQRLINQVKANKNFSLRFIDLSSYIGGIDLRVFSYYSEAIYFRLFAPHIMVNYDKVIYLDCDLVTERDLYFLWAEDIGDNYVAAVRDIGVLLHYYTRDRRQLPEEYFTEQLEGIDPDGYFNSGVLIMNFRALRRDFTKEQIAETVSRKKWNFPDQDILNVICHKRTHYLDMAWNTVPENTGNRRIANILRDVPQAYSDEYMRARRRPYIVHYAMREKPWLYPSDVDAELSVYFWKYALRSTYVQDILNIKRRNCSPAELAYIFKDRLGLCTAASRSADDIYYTAGKFFVGRLSQVLARYEFFSLKGGVLRVEGCTWTVLPEEEEKFKVALNVNGRWHGCELFGRFADEMAGEATVARSVGFRADVPLDKNVDEYVISLYVIVDGVCVRKQKINYGQFFPVDRVIPCQYCFCGGYALSVENGTLIKLKRCGAFGRARRELSFLRSLWRCGEDGAKKAVFARIYTWLNRAMSKKSILIIEDNFLADDNGAALFSHIRRNYPERKVYFAMERGNENYRRMKKIGKVVFIESRKFKLLLLRSRYSATSIEDIRLVNPFRQNYRYYRDILCRRKYIFLQHGVTKDDISKEHNKRIYNTQGFVTSSVREYRSLLQPQYFFDRSEVWLTGMPRFDLLYRDEKRCVCIMPTWRKQLKALLDSGGEQSLELFRQSEYFKFYYDLLHDERLISGARKYGYTLFFMPHPLIKKHAGMFVEEGGAVGILDCEYRRAFAVCDLVVTDYSSVVFDFAYLKKPIVYAQFDREEFFSGGHAYGSGYFDYERDGFGEVCFDLDATVRTVIGYMERGCKLRGIYAQRIDDFFAFHDKNNCERVVKKIYEDE